MIDLKKRQLAIKTYRRSMNSPLKNVVKEISPIFFPGNRMSWYTACILGLTELRNVTAEKAFSKTIFYFFYFCKILTFMLWTWFCLSFPSEINLWGEARQRSYFSYIKSVLEFNNPVQAHDFYFERLYSELNQRCGFPPLFPIIYLPTPR